MAMLVQSQAKGKLNSKTACLFANPSLKPVNSGLQNKANQKEK